MAACGGENGTQIVMIMLIFYDLICANQNHHKNQRSKTSTFGAPKKI